MFVLFFAQRCLKKELINLRKRISLRIQYLENWAGKEWAQCQCSGVQIQGLRCRRCELQQMLPSHAQNSQATQETHRQCRKISVQTGFSGKTDIWKTRIKIAMTHSETIYWLWIFRISFLLLSSPCNVMQCRKRALNFIAVKLELIVTCHRGVH